MKRRADSSKKIIKIDKLLEKLAKKRVDTDDQY